MGVQELDVGLIFSKSIFARLLDLGHHTQADVNPA
jgi:hypothetical protein